MIMLIMMMVVVTIDDDVGGMRTISTRSNVTGRCADATPMSTYKIQLQLQVLRHGGAMHTLMMTVVVMVAMLM